MYLDLANISNLDLFVDQEMLSYVGEAWCSPDNLVAGGLHLSHIHHYHRQTRGAWGNNFEKVFFFVLSQKSFCYDACNKKKNGKCSLKNGKNVLYDIKNVWLHNRKCTECSSKTNFKLSSDGDSVQKQP